MSNFKFSRRQATAAEIERAGFQVIDGQARSNTTGAFYDCANFLVANSATIDGERQIGLFLYLDDDLPAAERVLVPLLSRGDVFSIPGDDFDGTYEVREAGIVSIENRTSLESDPTDPAQFFDVDSFVIHSNTQE